MSAAPGATTPTRAAPATCPRTSTRSRSRRTRLERDLLAPAGDPRLPAARAPTSTACARTSASTATVERRRVGRRRSAGTIETSTGRCARRVVVAGMGPLAEPSFPDDPGARRLRGRRLPLRPLEPRLRPDRQARRRHRHRRVGDPVRARDPAEVAQLHVVPAHAAVDHAAPDRADHARCERALYRRFPALQKLVRGGIYAARELLVLGFVKNPRLMRLRRADRARHLAARSRDPELREKLTPDYTIGCKRILPSNRWYPALSEPNVELVTGGVEEVTRDSIVTADGERARGRRDHLRHRLPGHRHAGRQAGARAGRPLARRASGTGSP